MQQLIAITSSCAGAICLGLGPSLPCNDSVEGSSLIRAFLFVVVVSQLAGNMN